MLTQSERNDIMFHALESICNATMAASDTPKIIHWTARDWEELLHRIDRIANGAMKRLENGA